MADLQRREFEPSADAHGGHKVVRQAPMNAAETFNRGQPIFVNVDGEAAEFPVDGTPALVADMTGPGRVGGIALNGPNDGFNDWRTRLPYATGALIQFTPFDTDTLYITRNYQSAVGTEAIPPGTARGAAFQLAFDNVSPAALQGWVVLAAAATYGTHVTAEILDVLDANGAPIGATDTTTGVSVLFRIVTNA